MDTKSAYEDKRFAKLIGSRLRQEREKRAWTQSNVAERIGSTRINISRWENGITTPGPYYRQKLGELFGKNVQELGFVPQDSEEHALGVDASADAPSHDFLNVSPRIWNMPYRRNPYFTGREAILQHLYTALRGKSGTLTQTQAISGLGGIGKTQIAVEYVYRYREEYRAIFWIDASTRETFSNHFLLIAALLDLSEQHEQSQDIIIRAVKRWLSGHTQWLLILDNVESLEMIVDFLPTDITGDVLLTTRLQALGTVAQSIEIEKMELDEGIQFLLRRAKAIAPDTSLEETIDENQAQAMKIVTLMDGLPLALDQAGAYIEEKHCGLSQYLRLYAIRRKDLLAQRGKFPTTHPDPVTTTWSLSFQQVKQENPAAADLLHLLAFLGPEAVPEELLYAGVEESGPVLGKAAGDPLKVNTILELLLHYSLIKRSPETETFSIHRLVQTALKDVMEPDTRFSWARRTLLVLNNAFPKAEPKTWKMCRRYLPHVLVCAESSEEYGLHLPEAARLFNEAASYLIAHSSYAQAELLLQKSLIIRQGVLEANNADTACTLNDLGVLYFNQGRYEEANHALQEALRIRRQVLGDMHPDVAETLDNLASLNRTRGAYSRSEQFYLHAQHILENVSEVDAARIAHCYFGLARVYYRQEDFDRAETLCLQAMDIQEKQFGENHPALASTLSVLAKIYQGQRQLDRAKKTNIRALRMRESISGPNHSQLATILNSLVEIYHIEGKYQEAAILIERALRIHEETLGPDHPFMAYSLRNKAENLFLQGDSIQAEAFYQKACAIRELHLGFEHLHTASAYADLARFYIATERYEEAEAFYRKALVIREHFFDHNHPLVIRTRERHMAVLQMLEQRRPTDR